MRVLMASELEIDSEDDFVDDYPENRNRLGDKGESKDVEEGEEEEEDEICEWDMKIDALNSQYEERQKQFDAINIRMDDLERSNEDLQDKVEAKDREIERLKEELIRTKEMLAQKEADKDGGGNAK